MPSIAKGRGWLPEDLLRFITELRALAARLRVQIVCSTTNPWHELLDDDIEWPPTLLSPLHKMFLEEWVGSGAKPHLAFTSIRT